ncbi:MAG: helix-turn-helix domain-containing protein [Balneolaceae bacterium]
MKVAIKNMVCARCIESVSAITAELRLPVEEIDMGVAMFSRSLTDREKERFQQRLKEKGFEQVADRDTEIVSQAKTHILCYLQELQNDTVSERLSDYLSGRMHYNYSYVSAVFSKKENKTIEQFFIEVKIEKVKELLSFQKWTLSEIADRLQYSSVQYLSNQFKKITGYTVTDYLMRGEMDRKPLDSL